MSRKYQHDADAIIQRLSAVERSTDLAELETQLRAKGYGGRNLVMNWAKRGRISQQFLETYSANEGVCLNWLVHGTTVANCNDKN